MSEKTYYLSLQELFLLLGKSGMDSFFGFSDSCAAQASEAELFCSLHRMTQKGMLRIQDETLYLEDGLRQIVQTVFRSFRCIIVRFSDPLRLPVCFYVADDVVQAELSETSQKRTVRLKHLPKELFIKVLQDLLMQAGGPVDKTELPETEWTPTAVYLAQEGLRGSSLEIESMDAVIWTTEFYDIGCQEVTFRCCLLDESLQKELLIISKDDAQPVIYSDVTVQQIAEQGGNRDA